MNYRLMVKPDHPWYRGCTYSVCVYKSMQLRNTLTHSCGHTLEGNTVYRLMLKLVNNGIECVLMCKQINAVKKDFN